MARMHDSHYPPRPRVLGYICRGTVGVGELGTHTGSKLKMDEANVGHHFHHNHPSSSLHSTYCTLLQIYTGVN